MVSSPTRWSNTVPARQAANASPWYSGHLCPPSLNGSHLKADGLKQRSPLQVGSQLLAFFLHGLAWLPSMTSLSTPTAGQNGSQHMPAVS